MILYLLYGWIIGFYGFGRISARFGPRAAQRCSMKQILKFVYGDPRVTPGKKKFFGDIKFDIFFPVGGIIPQKGGRKRPILSIFDEKPEYRRIFAFIRKTL